MTLRETSINIGIALIVWAIIILILSCSNPTSPEEPPQDGLVAQRSCDSCHEWIPGYGIPDSNKE